MKLNSGENMFGLSENIFLQFVLLLSTILYNWLCVYAFETQNDTT